MLYQTVVTTNLEDLASSLFTMAVFPSAKTYLAACGAYRFCCLPRWVTLALPLTGAKAFFVASHGEQFHIPPVHTAILHYLASIKSSPDHLYETALLFYRKLRSPPTGRGTYRPGSDCA